MRRLPIYYALLGTSFALLSCCAAENWTEALRQMPLKAALTGLNWSNCVPQLLSAFSSNDTVKALIFMPGATDELYTFRRVRCPLPPSATLLDAICGLTNQGLIQASFQAPFLLLHTSSDLHEPEIHIESPSTQQKLQQSAGIARLFFIDRDWDTLQPILKWSLRMDIRPWRHSQDSWHFYRHSLSAYGLTGWQALKAVSLAGKTKFTIRSRQILFQPDTRPRYSLRLQGNLPDR